MPPTTSVAQDIDWDNFRDHIPTADQQGRRQWVYPRRPSGPLYKYRTWLSYALLAFLFLGPFLRINGNPILMMNVIERKFTIMGFIFWPQDTLLFAVAMLTVFIMIALFTAVFGRIWCGWLCPQTVLMEMLFRKIEYAIEGDADDQRKLNASPWTPDKIRRKALKHGVFFGLSFIIGNLLLAYIIGSDALFAIITDNPFNHLRGLTAMILFSLLFYGIFARFREQACTFVCPYGRFQSVLLDENSIVVAYDHKRGEKRGRFSRKQSLEERAAAGLGHCVNCGWCVEVCPTGIDIRNGTQMECVNCTACIDACNNVMDRVGLPQGLIRYASLNGIERGERLKITPRIKLYCAILAGLSLLLVTLVALRPPVEATILRAPGSLFQQQPNGNISNVYLVKVMNKTTRDIPVRFELLKPEGNMIVAGETVLTGREQLASTAIVVELAPDQLAGEITPVRIGVFANDKKVDSVKTSFLGPRRSGAVRR